MTNHEIRQSEKEKVLEEREAQRLADIERLLATDWGRRLAYWLVVDVGMLMKLTFAGAIKDGPSAAQHASHSDGRRYVASALYQAIEKARPGAADALIAEGNAASRSDQARVDAAVRSAEENQQ